MTDYRELLELSALAMGMDGRISDLYHGSGLCFVGNDDDGVYAWLDDDGDCARLCAALLIGTTWWNHKVECWCVDELKDINIDSTPEQFTDHNDDRSAAWRLAALRVAAEIGKGMRG